MSICDCVFSKDMIPPIIIIPEIALETLISGEYNAGVTCQSAKYPIKQESAKIVKSNHVVIVLIS